MTTILLAAALASSLVAGAILMRDNRRLRAKLRAKLRAEREAVGILAGIAGVQVVRSWAALDGCTCQSCQETRRLAN